jgi:putative transcriptional regulator
MKKGLAKGKLIGALGIESIVALRQIGIEPNYLYGVPQAAIEASRSGLPFVIVCASSESPVLLQRLNEENLKYTLIDTRNRR